MAADLLDYPQRDACVTHLSQGGAPEAVSASSFNADTVASFPQKTRRRVAGDVSPVMSGVAAWKQVSLAGVRLPESQERSQVFNNRDGAGC